MQENYSFKEFKLDNEDLEKFPLNLENLLKEQEEIIEDITTKTTYKEIIGKLQELDELRELFFNPLSHLNSVKNSKETQKAYEESLPLLSKFHSKMAQNEKLFEAISKIEASNEEEKRVLEEEIKEFILSGINLEKEKKKRLEEINLELSTLSNEFSQNLLDATHEYELIIENEEDVKSLPISDKNSAKVENGYRFTLQIPSYLAYMSYGSNRKYREELYKAYNSRASKNSNVIDKILKLKEEKANILGFDSYAKYALKRRDAKDENSVIEFLEKLIDSAKPYANKELKALKEYALKLDNIKLDSYDVAYYAEKLKEEKFDFDEKVLKPYFKQSNVLNGLIEIISELFEVEFKEINISTWDDCVKVYDIYEKENLKSRIYFDLEARENKRGGAWMDSFETHFVDTKKTKHLSSAFIVCNFAPSSKETPSLLRHDDIVTLFHEMGHAIHHLFGEAKERNLSGINGVAWDVVEFPSQFLENFAYEESVLKRFAKHYETNEEIPQKFLDKIKETKNYNAGLGILRQIEFGLFDFKLHQKLYQGSEVQTLLDEVREKTTLLKPPSYNKFQNGFAHIFAGGYSAGYYSYKWAEVLSADAFFECLDENGFNKEKAKGYKEHILKNASKKDMSQLYKEWLNREASVESLMKLYDLV